MAVVESSLVMNLFLQNVLYSSTEMRGVLIKIAQRHEVSQLAVRNRTNRIEMAGVVKPEFWLEILELCFLVERHEKNSRIPRIGEHLEEFDFASLDIAFGCHPGYISAPVNSSSRSGSVTWIA